ncbi:MAG: ABC transporter ATP-binding protein [Chloroflexi bacterium]|nr:MAG: ABC transporter ATP-binding protein [Chloroflexota bacterium]MBL1194116.1 ABC transporter ATP-binding protein [Chloroflexota bacterium]NOH11409.1 ABC transporter ATP-binding protein [Chloroflexota bacterium]
MISAKNLTYTYPGASAETLHGLNFEIAEGEIFGFLGPSGAGKTTTQNILIGLLKEYQGHITVMDREVSQWGQDYYEHLGVSFELPNHYLKLTALENLNHFGSLYNGETLDPLEALTLVDLQEDANKRVSDFSKGMKGRLNLARSLLHKPRLLFLDEPTTGLDPVNARKIKDLVLDLRSQGTTIFVTTHDMSVADELCDRVAFITAGNISLIDAPTTLKKQHGKRTVRVEYLNGGQEIQHQDFPIDGLIENKDFVALMKSATRVETIHTQETTLDNIFIEVTGQELAV